MTDTPLAPPSQKRIEMLRRRFYVALNSDNPGDYDEATTSLIAELAPMLKTVVAKGETLGMDRDTLVSMWDLRDLLEETC